MKKITHLTFVCFFLLSLNASAQITKGSLFLGGSLSASSEKNERMTSGNDLDSKTTYWAISPQIGKAIKDNKIVGIFLQFGGQNITGDFTPYPYNKDRMTTIGGGIFYRLYVPLNSRFYVMGESSLGVFGSKRTQKADEIIYSKYSSTAVTLSATPGLSFRATKKLYLETAFSNLFSFAYYKDKTDYYDATGTMVTQTDKTNRIGASANANGLNSIAIGVRWILPSK